MMVLKTFYNYDTKKAPQWWSKRSKKCLNKRSKNCLNKASLRELIYAFLLAASKTWDLSLIKKRDVQ